MGYNFRGEEDFRWWQLSHVPGGRANRVGPVSPHNPSPQFSHRPHKQSCYKKVFEKGFSELMGQLKRFHFIQVKRLLSLHLQVNMGQTDTHTHTGGKAFTISYLELSHRSYSRLSLEHFPVLAKFLFKSRLLWIWNNISAQTISSSFQSYLQRYILVNHTNKAHISNQIPPKTRCGVLGLCLEASVQGWITGRKAVVFWDSWVLPRTHSLW